MIPNDVIPGNATESIWDIMKRCSLSEAEETAQGVRRAKGHDLSLHTVFPCGCRAAGTDGSLGLQDRLGRVQQLSADSAYRVLRQAGDPQHRNERSGVHRTCR